MLRPLATRSMSLGASAPGRHCPNISAERVRFLLTFGIGDGDQRLLNQQGLFLLVAEAARQRCGRQALLLFAGCRHALGDGSRRLRDVGGGRQSRSAHPPSRILARDIPVIHSRAIGPLGEVAQNNGTAIAIGRIGAVREQKRKRAEGETQGGEDRRRRARDGCRRTSNAPL